MIFLNQMIFLNNAHMLFYNLSRNELNIFKHSHTLYKNKTKTGSLTSKDHNFMVTYSSLARKCTKLLT